MLSSSSCDYSDTYKLVSATITVSNAAADGAAANSRKNVIIKNCTVFPNCISEIK